MPKISSTSIGARPRDGSSNMTSLGCDMSARPITSICCSPPEQVAAGLVAQVLKLREIGIDPSQCISRTQSFAGNVAGGKQLIFNRQLLQYPPALHDLNDPHFGYFLRVDALNAVAVKLNITATYFAYLSFEQTGNSFQGCTFPGTIGSQKRYDFPVIYLASDTPRNTRITP